MNQKSPESDMTTQLVVGDRAPVVSLPDHTGTTVTLASVWQWQPRVLLFVRHFG